MRVLCIILAKLQYFLFIMQLGFWVLCKTHFKELYVVECGAFEIPVLRGFLSNS